MNAVGLIAAVAIDLLATAGLILLAARIYERAILRIGAPVKLRGALAIGSQSARKRSKGIRTINNADTNQAKPSGGESRPIPLADLGLRMAAAVFVLAGAAIGFSHPLAIVLVAVGLLLLVLEQSLKHWPRRPAD
jgi:hypothetical protein